MSKIEWGVRLNPFSSVRVTIFSFEAPNCDRRPQIEGNGKAKLLPVVAVTDPVGRETIS